MSYWAKRRALHELLGKEAGSARTRPQERGRGVHPLPLHHQFVPMEREGMHEAAYGRARRLRSGRAWAAEVRPARATPATGEVWVN